MTHSSHSILSQAPIPIAVLKGPDHRFEFANPRYIEWIGGRDPIGKTVREVFPELSGKNICELFDEVFATGVPIEGKEFVYQPIRDAEGVIEGILLVATDVASQVDPRAVVEDRETGFRQLADSMPQIVWTANADGTFTYMNKRWTNYSGSINASEWGMYVHPEDLEKALLIWMFSVQTGENFEAEFRLRKMDQTYRWHLVRALPVKDEKGIVLKWHGTCTDIEDQMRVQAALVETSQELQRSEHNLQIANDQAEMASQLKTSFLANMSHEIRTPLGAILGFTEILKTGTHGVNERNRYLDVISKNGKALTRIIDDILDLSKVEAGRLEIEPVSFEIRALVDEVLGLFSDTVREKGIHLYATYVENLPTFLISDPTRLRQILINLIGNAVKFTKEGEIKVVLNADTVGDQARVLIEIADTGVGLTAEQAERLFQPFSQADNSTTRKFGGTGLGLALSKRLAWALNGDVTLEQYRPGEGCVFCVEIRAFIPEPATTEETVLPEKSELRVLGKLAGVRVLVVDDSVDNLELLEIFLQGEELVVETASRGEEAIEKAMKTPFDVILMDIQMPGIDGHEAVRTLRARGYTLPIIALTAHAMKEERERTAASGFNDHVSKPISFDTLTKAILKQVSGESHLASGNV